MHPELRMAAVLTRAARPWLLLHDTITMQPTKHHSPKMTYGRCSGDTRAGHSQRTCSRSFAQLLQAALSPFVLGPEFKAFDMPTQSLASQDTICTAALGAPEQDAAHAVV